MADIKIAGRIKAGTADNIAGYASEILFDDEASDKTVKEKLEGKQDTLTFDNVPTKGSNNPVKSGGVYQAIQDIDVSSQISGKADKSEMSVVAGTGANADKTTITLKSGTSATVLTQHQDVSEFLREGEVFGSGGDSAASFNSYADTVWNKQQTLSESQKQQVRENIGIADLETIRNGAAAGTTAIQSVTVGTTTTGAAGSSASVVNSGTATAPVLDFTIPQGAQGVKGDTVIMGNEDTYTLYNTTGDAVDGAMTQQAVTRELAELEGEIDKWDIVSPSTISSGWALTGVNGLCEADSSASLVKYQVTAGTKMRLKLSKDNDGVYQWQNNASVGSQSNTYLIGSPVTTATDSEVTVPDGATYLIVSQNNSNTTNEVSVYAGSQIQKNKEDIATLSGKVTYGAPDQLLDLSTLTKQSALIQASNNKWLVGYRSYKSVFLPVTPTHQYKIKANANYSCTFAMLVSNEYTNSTAVVYANGGARTVIASGEEVIVTAGSNANYLWILTNGESANTNMSPEYVAEYFGGVSTVKDKIEDIEEEIVDRTTIGDTPNEPIDLEQYTPSGIFIGNDGKWKINYSSYMGIIIPITAGTTYRIAAGNNGANYALLPSNTYTNEQSVAFCAGTGRSSVSANTSKIFIAPSDANYMWIYTSYSNTVYTPKELIVYNGQEQINEYLDERRGFFTKTKVIVAASNSTNPTEADYICTGTNDGAVIKQAISYAITNKIGTVHLKSGNYYLDTLDSNNAFLTIDLQDAGITIEGGGYGRQAALYVTYNAYAALDNATTYKVVYIKTTSRWSGSLRLQDIIVRTPWNQKKIIGIDMVTYEGCIIMQSVNVFGYNDLYASQVGHSVSVSNPPDAAVEGSIGIRTICKTPNGANGNTFRNSGAHGWYEGWAINGEHVLCIQCNSIFNVYGYTFDHYANGAEQHPNVLLRCVDERNVNGPRFYNNTKSQGILIMGLNFERKSDLAPGGQLGLAATEETVGQHRGIITYTMGYGTGSSTLNSTTHPFWEDGHGHGMKTTNLSQLQACSTSVRNGYKPNYLQRIWDTTLNKEVICIDEANKTWVDALGNTV